MRGLLLTVALLTGLNGAAHAVELRVAVTPPLSDERWRDALRSYVDDAVAVADVSACAKQPEPSAAQALVVCLGRLDATNDTNTLVLVDADETFEYRFPKATRDEDLYRTAALKVHGYLARRVASASPGSWAEGERRVPPAAFDVGLALVVPRLQPSQGALRLGLAVPLTRFTFATGIYLQSSQFMASQGVDIEYRQLPMFAALAYAPISTRVRPEFGVVAAAMIHRVSSSGADVLSQTHTTVSPRIGASLAVVCPLSSHFSAVLRATGLWALWDERYLVDGRAAVPESGATLLVDLGVLAPGI